MTPKRAPNLPLGMCFNCLQNHLIKDCPYPRQTRKTNALLALARYCLECGIKHLVFDCPLNPKKKKKSSFELARDHSII